ncbi:hypothetical protein GCM10007989_15050 [Devosia pacifica]|uniref:Uncharacterized protein n=1 Tax=Devosia pacifica TaxID=1335967 RepID=A0A918S2R3_9HYPH|nr:hypothetical protein [Devosia pacifica]GHA20886.1 hypothetical protein GCM10007989_15050 [Devosia pacifica]
MRKTILAALVATVGLTAAAPAFADTGRPFGEGSSDSREFAAYSILVRLQQSGVDATNVEEWGPLVRAYVRQDDGSTTMLFFEPDTLQQVTL